MISAASYVVEPLPDSATTPVARPSWMMSRRTVVRGTMRRLLRARTSGVRNAIAGDTRVPWRWLSGRAPTPIESGALWSAVTP